MGQHGVARLNALDEAAARDALGRCCACETWIDAMLARRPFEDTADLFATADAAWRALAPREWRQAFAAHPRIGDQRASDWSAEEQAGVRGASTAVADQLRALNARYEERFGHVFLICATGRPAGELLAELERRIANDPDREMREAADEQRKITRLRLQRLVGA